MQMPKRPESTSWWRILPAVLWGGVAAVLSQPVVNIPPNDPSYFWRVKEVHLVLGLGLGFLLYLLQRAFKLNKSNPAIMLSGLRTAGVVAILSLLLHRDLGPAIGSGIVGFLLGMLFYAIERGVAKGMPHTLGGDPPAATEVTAKPSA